MRTLTLLCLFLFASASVAAGRFFSGSVQEGGHVAAGRLGEYGALLICTGERWEAFQKSLADLKVKAENRLGAIDFAKEDLVVVFHYGDEGDKTSWLSVTGDAAGREVRFAMSYIIYKQRRGLTLGVWSVLAVPVEKSAKTSVSVVTYHPMNGGPHPTPDKGRLEYQWALYPDGAEAIGGLTATIKPESATVKAGDDILVRMTLSLAGGAPEKFGSFARSAEALHVWDGKYSNGYRNHAFEVTTPDGKTHFLRPSVIDRWDKNAPHPVEITAQKPYLLPNWVEGQPGKSLKSLGLDTSRAGVYTVQGVYLETAEPIQNNNPALWGGVVRSNRVRIEVK